VAGERGTSCTFAMRQEIQLFAMGDGGEYCHCDRDAGAIAMGGGGEYCHCDRDAGALRVIVVIEAPPCGRLALWSRDDIAAV